MDRKQLKETGKNLFRKNYWYSVIVAFLMAFTGTASSGSVNFNFDFSSDSYSSDAEMAGDMFGNGGTSAFFDEFFGGGNIDAFLDEFIHESIGIVLILILFAVIAVGAVLGYFIFNSFRCGGIRYFLKSRKNQPAEIKEVFENLKDKTNINIAKVTFSRDITVFLWSLLFLIPGIIKHYEYWAVDYILAVRPDIDKSEAKRLSKAIMDGNKFELYILEWSFVGWELLTIFTMGLLNIFYVNPYKQATYAEYFSQLRLEALAMGKITPNDIPDYEFIDPQAQYQSPYYAQPKNVVFRPDGMPMGNTVNTQPPFQQPFTQPTQPPFTQPMAHPVEQPTPTEPVAEAPIENAIIEETNENNPDATI